METVCLRDYVYRPQWLLDQRENAEDLKLERIVHRQQLAHESIQIDCILSMQRSNANRLQIRASRCLDYLFTGTPWTGDTRA